MELLVIIATWLVVTADGYTFQKPVRPADVHYPMASHPHLDTGGYGGHPSWVSRGVNAHPVAGTRRQYTPRQPVNQAPGARSYFPKQSYVPAPVAPVSSAYQAQHGTTINTKLPYAPKASSLIKPMAPKQPEKMAGVTSQSYPSVPAAKSHGPVYSPAYSPAEKPVPAEASNRPGTSSLVTNLPPQRWIPSYGVGNTKTAVYPPYPTRPASATTEGYQQQRAKQPAGQVSTMKMKNEKETSNEGSLETPLQTAVLIIRKPSQEAKMKSKGQTPDVPAIISEMRPNVANDYPTPTFPLVTETVSANPSTMPTPDTPSYQNPSVNVPLTLSPSTSVTNSNQEDVPPLAPEDKSIPLQTDAPSVPVAPTQVNAVHTPQSVSPDSNGEYVLQPVHPTTDSTAPMTGGSYSGESQEAIYKTNANDQQLIPEPAVSYQVPLQSAYATSTNLQLVEEIAPQIAETKKAVISEPNYAPQDAQQQPAEEPPTFRGTPVPSFDDSAIPKYVLGPYPSLVLPEPPLELASSAYGVAQLGVEEAQPILASQHQSVGSYGVPAIRLDNTELQEQWGYYSAEPFQSTSSDLSHTNTLPSTLGGGYQQPLATNPVNHPQSSYGFQQPPQQSGYRSGQQSTTELNNHYQTSHQSVTVEDLNHFQAAANRWIASNGANVVGRHHSAISDKVPVAILSSENVLNEDGSFSYNYETEDGIKVEASGYQKEIGGDPEGRGTVAKGSYSYTAPDGVKISVTWVADENGFQPTGDHIPTPPPFPVDIAHLSASEQTGENAVPTGWVRPAYAY